ncbi:hypothetical protein [Aquimarina agarilytica]|uniref:hypothetical protein n=1 Tax=Aquimarina agarilytica TaxID=1087449 RepID=UPI000289237C|nr:hypothetical protein [Aquimarina agarilytica]
MESKKAQKLITKILSELDHAGIIINTVTDDLKELRPYALEEQNPLLVKVIRLTYEHIEAYQTFAIAIPDDEPIEVEEGEEVMVSDIDENQDPKESLAYLVSLFKDLNNKMNILDLKAYRDALNEYTND